MPIITIQTIEGVVLQSPEQKHRLLRDMTDTFISVVGELARPYTYCLIQETPLHEWSLAGRPLPDLPFLYGPEYAQMHAAANAQMRGFVESQGGEEAVRATIPPQPAPSARPGQPAAATPAGGDDDRSLAAQAQWAGGIG